MNLVRQVNVFLLSSITVLLPLNHQLISPVIGLWILTAIAVIIGQRHKFKFNLPRVLLMAFYVLLGIGMSWSDNSRMAGFDMEVKMSLFIFPFLFSFLEYTKQEIQRVMHSFYLGLIASGLVLLVIASINFSINFAVDHYFYANLSPVFHPSYLSYYYMIGMMVLMVDLKTNQIKSVRKRRYYLILLSFFFLYNILLLSKIGIIVATLFLMYFVIHWIHRERKYWQGGIIFIGLLSVFYLSYLKSPYVKQRVDEVLETFESDDASEHNGSTGIRIQVWQQGLDLMQKRPVLGYGTGDVKDELVEAYLANGITTAYEKKLNAHNQFLQVGIALGSIGLLLFLAIFIVSIYRGVKANNQYLIGFVILSIFYLFPESMLENQAGTISFALFFSLFNVSVYESKYHNE